MGRGPLLTVAEKAEIWARRGRGEPVWMIARHMGRSRRAVRDQVTSTGGGSAAPAPALAARANSRGARRAVTWSGRRRVLSSSGRQDAQGAVVGFAGGASERGPRTLSIGRGG